MCTRVNSIFARVFLSLKRKENIKYVKFYTFCVKFVIFALLTNSIFHVARLYSISRQRVGSTQAFQLS